MSSHDLKARSRSEHPKSPVRTDSLTLSSWLQSKKEQRPLDVSAFRALVFGLRPKSKPPAAPPPLERLSPLTSLGAPVLPVPPCTLMRVRQEELLLSQRNRHFLFPLRWTQLVHLTA